MDIITHVNAYMALPKRWQESEQEVINNFFKNKVPTALMERTVLDPRLVPIKRCSVSDFLHYANRIMQGAPVALAKIQGLNSYTIICPERHLVIQFRTETLDIKTIDEAKQMYGGLVASATYLHDFILPVYTFSVLPGQLHIFQRVSRDSFPLEREKRTVMDLARLIATASHFPHSQSRYESRSWTKFAEAAILRLKCNSSLRRMAPEVHDLIVSLKTRLHLLDALPGVLTHSNLGEQKVFVEKDAGTITGVTGFDEARIEAFGINIYSLYEDYLGRMEDGHWSPYDMPAGEQYPGLSVCEVLTRSFWDVLWANTAPSLGQKDFEEAVGVALRVGIAIRFFGRGMLDEIDVGQWGHVTSLDHAKGILLLLTGTGMESQRGL